jgi:hypothetical protein
MKQTGNDRSFRKNRVYLTILTDTEEKVMKHFCFTIFVVVLICGLSACDVVPPAPTPTPTSIPSTSEALITVAWGAWDAKNYQEVIIFTQQCIDNFEGEALAQQAALASDPPVGTVPKPTADTIFLNWALNDVATSFYLLGKAQLALGNTLEAKDAFLRVSDFPGGRAWNPEGFFWSPLEAAQRELANIP